MTQNAVQKTPQNGALWRVVLSELGLITSTIVVIKKKKKLQIGERGIGLDAGSERRKGGEFLHGVVRLRGWRRGNDPLPKSWFGAKEKRKKSEIQPILVQGAC